MKSATKTAATPSTRNQSPAALKRAERLKNEQIDASRQRRADERNKKSSGAKARAKKSAGKKQTKMAMVWAGIMAVGFIVLAWFANDIAEWFRKL